MICRRAIIVTGAAALAAPSGAYGLSTANDLSMIANMFRRAAARSVTTAVSDRRIGADAARSLDLPRVGVPLLDGFHRYLFSATATVYGHRPAASGVIGYYAPLLDCWWVALCSEGRFIADGRLAPAPLFRRESPGDDNLAEIRTYGPIETVRRRIGAATRDFRAEFALEARGEPHAFARIAKDEDGATLVRDRIVELAATLDRFAEDGEAFSVLDTMLAELAAGTTLPSIPMSDQALQSFARLRAANTGYHGDFAPVLAMQSDGWWLIASASGTLGSQLLFTEIERGAQPALTRLAVVNLDP